MDALHPLWDAERPGLHSHAERGNDQVRRGQLKIFCKNAFMSAQDFSSAALL